MNSDGLVALMEDVLDDDPAVALAGVRQLREHLGWLEQRAVGRARLDGWSWAQIGRLLGRTRQSVREKHDRVAPRRLPALRGPSEWQQAEFLEALAAGRREREVEDCGGVPW